MDFPTILDTVMIVCFGFSWPMNLIKAYKARTAKATSLPFILLIISGYIAGIVSKIIVISTAAEVEPMKIVNLVAYLLNLVIVSLNLVVYFRNRALDQKAQKND